MCVNNLIMRLKVNVIYPILFLLNKYDGSKLLRKFVEPFRLNGAVQITGLFDQHNPLNLLIVHCDFYTQLALQERKKLKPIFEVGVIILNRHAQM